MASGFGNGARVSGPDDILRQALEVARVAGDQFVGLRFGRNQGVPVVIHSRALDAQALGVVKTMERFFLGQLGKLEFLRESSQPDGAFILGEDHPVGISLLVGDFHAPPGHGGKEFRQKMQAGYVVSAFEAAKHFG